MNYQITQKHMTTAHVISTIKYLSNLDHCQSSEDMQYALEKINDLLETEFPDIPELDEDEEDEFDDE